MEIRILESDEYHLLESLSASDRSKLMASGAIVVAAMSEGKVKGHLMLLHMPHVEAAWLDEDIRNGIVGARMEALLIKRTKELGATKVIAFATDDKMESYVQRLGYERLASAWIKEI